MKTWLLAALLAVPAFASSPGASKSWDFSVLLDGSKIGYHRFELREDEGQRLLTSEASFNVRFCSSMRFATGTR